MKQLTIAFSFATAAAFAGALPQAAQAAAHGAGNGASAPAAASHAADATTADAQPGTPQRSKMKACNADARTRDLHGLDRKAFMKQCLSAGKAKPVAAS